MGVGLSVPANLVSLLLLPELLSCRAPEYILAPELQGNPGKHVQGRDRLGGLLQSSGRYIELSLVIGRGGVAAHELGCGASGVRAGDCSDARGLQDCHRPSYAFAPRTLRT